MSTEALPYSQLRHSAPDLHRALTVLDESYERQAGLPRTPGTFTVADLDEADRTAPDMRQILGASVGNASAASIADALDIARTHAAPPLPPEPQQPSVHEIEEMISDVIHRARIADQHDGSGDPDARAIIQRCAESLEGLDNYTPEHAIRLARQADQYDGSSDQLAFEILQRFVRNDPHMGAYPEDDVRVAIQIARQIDQYDGSSDPGSREVLLTYHRALLGHPDYRFEDANALARQADQHDGSGDPLSRLILQEYNDAYPPCCG